MASVDDILQNVNQPVIDYLVDLIVGGKSNEAFKELKRLEGHWLADEDIVKFIIKVKQVYGGKDNIL